MRCPVCRASDNQTEQCRRCKADLSLLFQVERDRSAHVAAAEWHAAHGAGDACVRQAKLADELRADGDSARLLAMGMLLRRDFAGALRAYRRTMGGKLHGQ
jgi:hypothetical protein